MRETWAGSPCHETYANYANSQRLWKITRPGDAQGWEQTLTWDANGQLTQKQTVDGANTETETYVWTPDGYLASATLDSGETVAYEYDHRGERVRRTLTDDTAQVVSDTHYLVDSMNPTGYSQVLAEIDIDPATGDRTVSRYNTIGDRVLAQTEISGGTGAGARTPVYLATDGLGSVRSAQTSHQEILAQSEAYDYTAFGSPHGSQTRSLTNYAFTGQVRDQDTGLQYHRARWLDTNVAQWLSQDTVFDFTGSFGNAFGYVGMNPIMKMDLLGTSFTLGSLNASQSIALTVASIAAGIYSGYMEHLRGGSLAAVALAGMKSALTFFVLGYFFFAKPALAFIRGGLAGQALATAQMARIGNFLLAAFAAFSAFHFSKGGSLKDWLIDYVGPMLIFFVFLGGTQALVNRILPRSSIRVSPHRTARTDYEAIETEGIAKYCELEGSYKPESGVSEVYKVITPDHAAYPKVLQEGVIKPFDSTGNMLSSHTELPLAHTQGTFACGRLSSFSPARSEKGTGLDRVCGWIMKTPINGKPISEPAIVVRYQIQSREGFDAIKYDSMGGGEYEYLVKLPAKVEVVGELPMFSTSAKDIIWKSGKKPIGLR